MLSRVIPLEYLKERDLMFWLPPGGQDNEVWADTWVILAELESADAATVLALLQDADVGAYIASPSGRRGATTAGVQLYVDREQHNRAVDVVMQFLRGKDQPAVPVKASKPTPKMRPKAKRRSVRILLTAVQVAAVAALIALGLLLAYYRGPSLFPTVHRGHHPAPVSDAPGINGSRP
ncbi:conserved hypothetical protein [uncultured Mycobacterium sp.]|uniref:Uncharacterized protein n=1 Tax=uncultured Mycobacterium sp. TaxID=171292 RepID=A0A1Y5PAP7_9MYCO|nr:conserved hypothetical protein [uncultured Mycobacterium sp.]